MFLYICMSSFSYLICIIICHNSIKSNSNNSGLHILRLWYHVLWQYSCLEMPFDDCHKCQDLGFEMIVLQRWTLKSYISHLNKIVPKWSTEYFNNYYLLAIVLEGFHHLVSVCSVCVGLFFLVIRRSKWCFQFYSCNILKNFNWDRCIFTEKHDTFLPKSTKKR